MKTRKFSTKVLAMLLTLVMVLSMVPTMALAANADQPKTAPFKFEDGAVYQSLLDITDWKETKEVPSGLKISTRAKITVADGKKTVQLAITGFSQYEAIYMVKQGVSVEEIDLANGGKIGDWTELTNYQALKDAGFVDPALNDKFVKLSPLAVDSTMDVGVYQFDNVDPMQKIGLVGCLKRPVDPEKINTACKTITFKSTPRFTTKTSFTTLLNGTDNSKTLYANQNGWAYEREAGNRWGPGIVGNIDWNTKANMYTYQSPAFLSEASVKKVSYEIKDGKLLAKLYLDENFKDANTTVYEAVKRNIADLTQQDPSLRPSVISKEYDGYLAGNAGLTYGTENLYDAAENCIKLTFNGFELMYGKDLRVLTDNMFSGHVELTSICLSENDYGPVSLVDPASGIIYTNGVKQLRGDEKMNITKNTAQYAIDSIKRTIGDGEQVVYSWDFERDGVDFRPEGGGYMFFPVPEGWDSDPAKFYAEITHQKEYEGNLYTEIGNVYPSTMQLVKIDGKEYIRYAAFSATQDIFHGYNVGMGKVAGKVNPHDFGKGLWMAEVKLLKAGSDSNTSMANLALEKYAILRIDENGNKSISLNFHPINMGEGAPPAYLGAIWNKSDKDVTYLNYEVDKDGKLLDNAGYNAVTEFPCVKGAVIELDESTWDEARKVYKCYVIPPAMAAGMPYEEVYKQPIATDLAFTKISTFSPDPDFTPLKFYWKPVLRKAVDKAKLFAEADYTAESFAPLKAALTAGEEYYKTLSDYPDLESSAEIEIKSQAIEAAIKNLVRNKPVAADKTALQELLTKAEAVQPDIYTADSFAALTKAVEDAKAVLAQEDATQEAVDAARAALQTAMDGLKTKDSEKVDVNKLPNGKYTLYAEMFKTDRLSFSMANNAINHNVWLEVTDDGYFLTVQFKGLAIFEKFGYLSNLSYFDKGYTYVNGVPTGKLLPAEVLEVQKDADGKVIVDQYNTAETPYPALLRFKLVDKAAAEFVPLQVFVPIMEAIAEDNGTQQVLMKLDWTKIKADEGTILPDGPEAEFPAVDAEDENTGIQLHADKNVFKEEVKLIVDPIVKGEIGYEEAEKLLAGLGEKFDIFDVKMVNGSGEEVAPNGKVTVSFPIPENVDASRIAVYRLNEDGTKTLVRGNAENGMYAVNQRTLGVYAVVITGSSNPQTGDFAPLMALAALVLLSAAAVAVISKKRRSAN